VPYRTIVLARIKKGEADALEGHMAISIRRREIVLGLLGGTITVPLIARAQTKVLNVGFLYPGPEPAAKPRIAAFISGLEELGLRVPDQVSLVPRVTGGDPNKLSQNGGRIGEPEGRSHNGRESGSNTCWYGRN
jgi:hypothetical protein